MPAAGRRNARPRRTPLATVIPALLALALVVGCTAGTSDTATGPATSSVDDSFPSGQAPGAWVPCRSGLECTTLEVPADWADPDGERISLAVARRPATSGDPRGVILVNPGGPGGSGLDWLAGVGDLGSLGTSFDLVSWDPRGVGASTRLDCDGVGGVDGTGIHRLPTTGPAADATATAVGDFVAACAVASPQLVDHLGTDQGVADMEAIRQATGAEQIDVIGLSYGTYLGLAYARAHPDRVRVLVLDAVVNPADSLEEFLAAQATAMESLLDEALGEDPTLWDDAAVRTNPATLAFAAIAATYDPVTLRQLPDALARAADGDDAALRTLADGYFGAANFAAYLGTLCADLDRPTSTVDQAGMAARLDAIAPRLGAAIAGEVAACAIWPVANGRRWTPVAPPEVAVLVVGGTGDAATPLALAESVADALGGSALVVREGGGHVSLRRSSCVADVVTRLLRSGSLPPDPTSCPT